MNPKLRTYLFLIGQLVAGMVVLVLVQQLRIPVNVRTGIIFTLLLLLNLLYVRLFDLKKELNTYWSLRKLPYLLAGIVAGLILIIIPMAAAFAAGKVSANSIHIDAITAGSVFFTFLIN